MPIHTLTFPEPDLKKKEDPEIFRYAIDGETVELPRFTEVIARFAYNRRLVAAGEKRGKLSDTGVSIAFALAVEDNEEEMRKIDYLDNVQTLELLGKWAEFKGAPAGE